VVNLRAANKGRFGGEGHGADNDCRMIACTCPTGPLLRGEAKITFEQIFVMISLQALSREGWFAAMLCQPLALASRPVPRRDEQRDGAAQFLPLHLC
jgi:hypothetical protein